ncbi:sensor histidine kinase [Rhizobium paknamense]|uniref:histidine kinase n=1 Tax=Rhizobium paknamense TaxID=1206817 RepID=A0ABU0IAS1_9HYPH|nr:HWE histidine kinase domain-containing protein [Rhizobium paknamense]MDQ0455309.1 two-component sensor histidine kinase [Rhizobium paknamense]
MRLRSKLDRLPSFKAMRKPLTVAELVLTYIASLVIFMAMVGLRLWIDPLLQGTFPYVTFFPAVLIVGFLFGIAQGALVAFLCGLASWYMFIPPYYTFDTSLSTVLAMALYTFVVITDLGLTALMMSAYRAEQKARAEVEMLAEQQEVMARELDHRLKNVFATINAIVSLSQKHACDVQSFARSLRERLNAMARSNLLLRGLRPGDETTVRSVIIQALEPFDKAETVRLDLHGPLVPVSGQAVVLLSLILHELGTNAAKYGALSVQDGKIRLGWHLHTITRDDMQEPALTVEWREIGGPAPNPPSPGSSGFGSVLINRVIGAVRGTVSIDFPETGAIVTLTLPLTAISPKRDEKGDPLLEEGASSREPVFSHG